MCSSCQLLAHRGRRRVDLLQVVISAILQRSKRHGKLRRRMIGFPLGPLRGGSLCSIDTYVIYRGGRDIDKARDDLATNIRAVFQSDILSAWRHTLCIEPSSWLNAFHWSITSL